MNNLNSYFNSSKISTAKSSAAPSKAIAKGKAAPSSAVENPEEGSYIDFVLE